MSDPYRDVVLPRELGHATLACPDCDVADALAALPSRAVPCRLDVDGGLFPGARRYRYLEDAPAGGSRADSHFQGVQRFGEHLLVTGVDWLEPAGHLLVARIETGPDGNPAGGRLERIVALDNERPHAGGIQRLGDILAVPLEGAGGLDSMVVFLRITDPLNPGFVGDGSTIVRRGRDKASAAAVAPLPGGKRLLVGVAWKNALDLYLSRSDYLGDGFVSDDDGFPRPLTIDLAGLTTRDPQYQSIAFLHPDLWQGAASGRSEIRVPIIALRNTSKLSNWYRGKNFADLLELHIRADRLEDWPCVADVSARRPVQFTFGRFDGNFAAAAGVDVEPDGTLALYAAHHWRARDGLHFSTCRAAPSSLSPPLAGRERGVMS
ncbi:MAG: hypothetical protein IRZ00_05990 [Gemmatimonadetes bacterium]|nr:hypothetical protein [Gemmatimonadota bacterium]